MIHVQIEGRVRVYTVKTFSVDDFYNTVVKHEEMAHFDRRLWDIRGLTPTPTATELKRLAQLARDIASQPRRIALVATEDLYFGLLRMYSVYREDGEVSLHIDRDREQALQWLEAQGPGS